MQVGGGCTWRYGRKLPACSRSSGYGVQYEPTVSAIEYYPSDSPQSRLWHELQPRIACSCQRCRRPITLSNEKRVALALEGSNARLGKHVGVEVVFRVLQVFGG